MILILFTILLWIIIIDNLLLGIFLLIKAYQAKFNNLYSIGFAFVLFFVALFTNFILGFGYFFQEIFTATGYYLIAIFTYLTFNKEKQDYRAKLILYLALILIVIRLSLSLTIEIDINPFTRYFERIIINCYMFLIFFWLGWSSFSTLKRLYNREIAPWIKTRYKTISIVSFLWPFHVIMAFFVPWDTEFGDPADLLSFIQFTITVILSLTFIIGMIIAWIIPERLKDYINRKYGYKPLEDSGLSEEKLMKLIRDQLERADNHGND
ncbi:MAG: hypothetical protein ACFE8B_14400 [Candidatus Hermodarchaeota archaeon]